MHGINIFSVVLDFLCFHSKIILWNTVRRYSFQHIEDEMRRIFLQQVSECEIPFADRSEAMAILGDHDEFLKLMHAEFGCMVVSRGDGIDVSGDPRDVGAVCSLIRELVFLYRQGARITPHEVRYGIKLVKNGQSDELHSLFDDTILVTASGRSVRPKTLGQGRYIDVIRHHDVTFGIGPAGTGKTYLAVVLAVAALRTHSVERIVLTRPAVEAGEKLGFLPGDMQDKVDPYLRPLYDALQDTMGMDTYQKLLAKGIVEIAPLAYMRGRTLNNAFVILDEAQNTTAGQMKMFLTRLGFGSKMVVTGDPGQTDLPHGAVSGLRQAVQILSGIRGIGIVRLEAEDVIRHEIVSRIVRAYDEYEKRLGDRQ